MGIYTTKPIKELSSKEFRFLIKDNEIVVWNHALRHLSKKQRKVFNEEELIQMLRKEKPRKVYLQENERYASYYRRKDGYRKLIVMVGVKNVELVSFMDVPELPKIRL